MKIDRQRRQCGGGKLMYWGVVMPNGLVSLIKVERNFNSEKYIQMLRNYAVKLLNLNMNPPFYFVQDNSRVHTSKKAMAFLQKQNFRVLDWPAKSPDINLMENVWKSISDLVYRDLQPHNITELEAKISAAVYVLNSEKRSVILSLYRSFRQRLTKLLVKNGNIV